MMAQRKNPNTCQPLSDEDLNLLNSVIKNYDAEMVKVGPKQYFTRGCYAKFSDEIYNFPVLENDVWVVTLPRSGTTVTQEMVWQICNDCDFENGRRQPLIERFPYFEFPMWAPVEKMLQNHRDNPEMCRKIRSITTLPWQKQYDPSTRRFIKTHMALSLLPPELLTVNCKVIYVARNLKDHLVSSYHHHKMLGRPTPDNFADFWKLCKKGLVTNLPYFEHIKEAWDLREHKNILFLCYEDIVKNLRTTIAEVAQFLGKTLTEKQTDQLVEHLKFENFKNNESVSKDYADFLSLKEPKHVRNGKVGSWKEELFTDELNREVEQWINENNKIPGLCKLNSDLN